MSHHFKPHPLFTAAQFYESLIEAEKTLSDYCASGKVNLMDDVFVFSHDGHWSVQKYKGAKGMLLWNISYLIDTHQQGDQYLYTINLAELLELMKCLVAESKYDYDMYAEVPHTTKQATLFEQTVWLSKRFLSEVEEQNQWWEKYNSITNLEDCFSRIQHITEIYGVALGFIKEYLLDQAFDLPGYMPKRYFPHLPNYKEVADELLIGDKSEEISEIVREIEPQLRNAVRELLKDNGTLFTEDKVNRVVKYTLNVFICFRYDPMGHYFDGSEN